MRGVDFLIQKLHGEMIKVRNYPAPSFGTLEVRLDRELWGVGEECPGVSAASSVGGSSPSSSSASGTLGPYGPLTAYDGEGRGDAWEAVWGKNHGFSFPHLPA